MNRYFTKTFFRFFIGFVVIITIAFGVIIVTSQFETPRVNSVANPQQ